MSAPLVIPFAEGEARLDWLALTDALAAGHERPRAELRDVLLTRGSDTLLNRSAWIDGMGLAVKAATIFPGNAGRRQAGGRRRRDGVLGRATARSRRSSTFIW